MAALGGVTLIKLADSLGSVAFVDDTKAALLLFGPDATDLDIGVPMLGNKLSDFEAVGLTAAYDTANSTNVYDTLKEFYTLIPKRELYVMLVAQATTLTSALDPTNADGAVKLLNFVNGNCVLGVGRKPPGAYAPTYSTGVDPDVPTAIVKAKLLREAYTALVRPVAVILGGRGLKGALGSIDSGLVGTGEGVKVTLLGMGAASLEANVGFELAWACKEPVHVRGSKVARGPLPLPTTQAYLTNGLTAEAAEASWSVMNARGFVFPRTYPLRNGYYMSSDRTMAADTSDYYTLANCRVMDKALVLAYLATADLIDADVDLEDNGLPAEGLVDQLSADATNRVAQQLAANASNVRVVFDANSNLISAQEWVVGLEVQPKGYSTTIKLSYGFKAQLTA